MEGRRIRIGTWNLKTGIAALQAASAIRELDLDIVCLQEIDRWTARVGYRDIPAEFFDSLQWNWAYGPSLQDFPGPSSNGKSLFYGNALGTRHPIGSSFVIDLGPADTNPVFLEGHPEQERRTAVIAKIAIGDTTVVAASTHLQFGALNASVRKGQARQLFQTIDQTRSCRQTIVAGDFNASKEELSGWDFLDDHKVYNKEKHSPGTIHGVDHVITQGLKLISVESYAGGRWSDHDMLIVEVMPTEDV